MDTKTLVVGQEVHIISGIYDCGKGTVVEVTPEGVVVQANTQRVLRFDNNGKELDASRRDRLGFGPSPESKFHTVLWQFAPEFQPWELEDFADRSDV
jgi:hypothetical protein